MGMTSLLALSQLHQQVQDLQPDLVKFAATSMPIRN